MSSPPLPRNRSMPESCVIPVLGYTDPRAAAAWLVQAFGLAERLRIADHRVQLSHGDGALVVAQQAAATGCSMMLRVSDVDAHCARARAAGARILAEPTTYPYGERQYSAADFAGHVWTFSESVADVDPAAWGGELVAPAD
ncbi:VOC family protein [Tahibacter caeni]|uniref:VOC family protein n=1 Tax=Tahibacter caeni TaxID=1453545 RepID=UPI0021485755|nr:VOC family protein [Tahibacter caeni]